MTAAAVTGHLAFRWPSDRCTASTDHLAELSYGTTKVHVVTHVKGSSHGCELAVPRQSGLQPSEATPQRLRSGLAESLQFAVMPVSFKRFAQRAVSSTMNLANSSGVLGLGSMPCATSFAFTSGLFSVLTNASLSFF